MARSEAIRATFCPMSVCYMLMLVMNPTWRLGHNEVT